MSNINNSILESQEIIATSIVQRAGFNSTVQATILSCEDESIGKYRCRYQDAIFYAFSEKTENTYTNGSLVYVLIPSNNMQKRKVIIGTQQSLGVNYISQAVGDEAYSKIGNNCVLQEPSKVFYLNTNNNYSYEIYKTKKKKVSIDTGALKTYLKKSSSLIFGANFKTSIQPTKQRSEGHFGIKMILCFNDNATNTEVLREYILDEDNMVGNPYQLTNGVRQYEIFDIDGENFVRLESIQLFCQNFMGSKTEKPNSFETGDIEIRNIEIQGAARFTEEQLNGVSVSFYTPKGTIFLSTLPKIPVTAEVRIKGKLASPKHQNIEFYWGKEDAHVSSGDKYYNNILGRGWHCLNTFNQLDGGLISWVADGDTKTFNIEDFPSEKTKIKVAILQDGSVFSKELTITNDIYSYQITIESSDGVQFYRDIGHPTLTCQVNKSSAAATTKEDDYLYYWAMENDQGVLVPLNETTKKNKSYNKLINHKNVLLQKIKDGYQKGTTPVLNALNKKIEQYNSIQRVDGNHIYNLQIREITNSAVIKCAVYIKNENTVQATYIGTGSIQIFNTFLQEGQFSLVVENGSMVYKYDSFGKAPSAPGGFGQKLQIPQLTFVATDNLGNNLNDYIKDSDITWRVPIKNTMLTVSESTDQSDQNYKYYHQKALSYGIRNDYDIGRRNNQIFLQIKYQNLILKAKTELTFTKDGQPGTNGTDYIIRLLPIDSNASEYPMITRFGAKKTNKVQVAELNWHRNITNKDDKLSVNQIEIDKKYNFFDLFKVQVWKSNQKVYDSAKPNDNLISDTVTIVPQILRHKDKDKDKSQFSIEKNKNNVFEIIYNGNNLVSEIKKYNGNKLVSEFKFIPYYNIIKCTVTIKDKKFYDTLPITTAWCTSNTYRISLKENTGFRYVVYSSDGTNPAYDKSNPFTFVLTEKKKVTIDKKILTQAGYNEDDIKEQFEEITTLGENDNIDIQYNLDQSQSYIRFFNLKDDNLTPFQKKAYVSQKCNGLSLNQAVTCVAKINGTIVARIYVPIHFLINRYGLNYLNDWDGNSIQIDNDDNYILSPQIGAGSKDEDNSFSGVIMGEFASKNSSTNFKTKTGLFGFAKGQRSFFLNSENGSALFGIKDKGQIVISPNILGKDNQPKALLWGGGYYETNDDEIPIRKNKQNTGMLIDLTTPEIKFGSGNFSVDKDGYITAKGGGSIAGWKISNDKLTSGKLTLRSKSGSIEENNYKGPAIYSKDMSKKVEELKNTTNGFYLSNEGLLIGSKFKVTNEGVLTLGYGAVDDSNESSVYHWTIDGVSTKDSSRSYISYGGTEFTKSSVYIGTDGISLGGTNFSVDNSGYLTATEGLFGNNIKLSSSGLSCNKPKPKNSSASNLKPATIRSKNNSGKMDMDLQFFANDSSTSGWWEITENGDATFTSANIGGSIYGSLEGGGFKFMPLGDSSLFNPSLINIPVSLTYGGKTVKGDQDFLSAFGGLFDQLYAKKATIDDLDILSKLKFQDIPANWHAVIDGITGRINKNNDGVITSITLTCTKRWAICAGSAGGATII